MPSLRVSRTSMRRTAQDSGVTLAYGESESADAGDVIVAPRDATTNGDLGADDAVTVVVWLDPAGPRAW